MTKSKMPVFSPEEEEELRRILERNEEQSMRKFPVLNKNTHTANKQLKESFVEFPRDGSMAKWLADINGLDTSQRRRIILQQKERLVRELRLLDDALAALNHESKEFAHSEEEKIREALHRFDDEGLKKQTPRSSQLTGLPQSKQPKQNLVSSTKPPPKMVTIQPQIKPIMDANDDWRAAISAPAFYNRDFSGISSDTKSRTVSSPVRSLEVADDLELDFDYGAIIAHVFTT